jgi:hypothetical protein
MNYNNDTPIGLGDKVIYAGKPGRIVFIIQENAFLAGFKADDWAYLKQGIGLQLEDGELFCLDAADEDLIKSS